jgi:hypothetical protein
MQMALEEAEAAAAADHLYQQLHQTQVDQI